MANSPDAPWTGDACSLVDEFRAGRRSPLEETTATLAAIGAAAGLGAIVRGNDTRAEVGDQVRSLGAEFVPVEYEEEGSGTGGYAKVMSEGFQKAQRALFAEQAKEVDVIITTALIPGKPAPKLITADMVKSMGSQPLILALANPDPEIG